MFRTNPSASFGIFGFRCIPGRNQATKLRPKAFGHRSIRRCTAILSQRQDRSGPVAFQFLRKKDEEAVLSYVSRHGILCKVGATQGAIKKTKGGLMHKGSILGAMLLLVSLCSDFHAQSSQSPGGTQGPAVNNQPIVDLPLARTFRPKLLMQDAMKIADDLIRKEHIDISSYWLFHINFRLYGNKNTADKDKIPCWYFWWLSNNGAQGDYVEIFVDMDGKAWRVPSM